jgi:CBS domain-containing protein
VILQAKTARELMTPGPYSVDETETVDQAATFFTERGFGSAVVIDLAGHPVGVITKSDLFVHLRERAAGTKAEPATVREVMTEAVFSVKEETPSRSVVEQLLALNVHHLFVVDPAGVVVGVITPTDVLRKLA